MICKLPLTLSDLPPPPDGRTGWPWSEASSTVPTHRPDGGQWPPISIVTPSYNQGRFIEETIRSVLLQSYPNMTYVIVDGASTDETQAVLEKYRRFIDVVISEPDKGQVDAIRKGFALLPEGLTNWINSDDVLAQGALRALGEAPLSAVCVTGDVLNFRDERRIVESISQSVSFEHFCKSDQGRWHQPGIWLRAQPSDLADSLDPQIHVVFDWLYFMRFFMKSREVYDVSRALCYFRIHDDAKTQKSGDMRERLIAAKQALAEAPSEDQRRMLRARVRSAERHVWAARELATAQTRRAAITRFVVRFIADQGVSMDRFCLGMLRRRLSGRI